MMGKSWEDDGKIWNNDGNMISEPLEYQNTSKTFLMGYAILKYKSSVGATFFPR